MILSTLETQRNEIRHLLEDRIQGHFDKNFVDLSKRCRVEADLDKWRPEVKEIWDQKKGNRENWFSIYFDNEFVCSFSMDRKPAEVELIFLKNLTRMYEDKEIYFDLNEYIIRDELKRIENEKKQDAFNKQLENERPEVKQVIKELNETA
jgi:hypothetical protein